MPIIKNYGLRWTRDSVNWGERGRAGTLDGKLATIKSSEIVDFREQIGIYVLYEPGFIPVYTGQAGVGTARLFARLKNHQNDHLRDRWNCFSWFGFRAVTESGELSERQNPEAMTSISYADALSEIEGILIEVLEPRLNKQGARWQQNAKEFVQEPAEAPWDKVDHLIDQVTELQQTIENLSKKIKA
ncbi:GIY-YIG nuclease family protein [Methylobacterium sp. Leaf399]|uniref:GIY-YIG nuclease family protein n=1 Tax=Methylobacterium sp. Leaf399 TaxID=1736364 RepID=UPI0012E36555|nr:GIY-YIG nuclease family protein [Methylobacterium sp. Leaf399]